jgi:hypothetical protein
MWEAEFVLPVMMGGDDQACLLAFPTWEKTTKGKQLQFLPSFLGLGPPSPPSLRAFPPSVPACLPACLSDSAHSPHRFRDKTRVRDLLTLLTGCLHSTRCTNRAIRCPPSSSIPNRPEKISVVWITLIYIFLSQPPPSPLFPLFFFIGNIKPKKRD